MQVPRLEKICINQGLGDAVSDKKVIDNAFCRPNYYRRSKGGNY